MFKLLLGICLFSIALATPKHKQQLEKYRSNGRNIRGVDANIEDVPYVLSLVYAGSHLCGAALISDTWAVTAAHCLSQINITDLSVRANSSSWEEGESATVKNVIINPNYDETELDSDIALVELNSSLSCANCKPIALSKTAPASNDSVNLVGWGICLTDNDPSFGLRTDQQQVVDKDVCIKNYNSVAAYLSDNMFCAADVNSSCVDLCYGEWGSPLSRNGSLVGVASWGYGCSQPGYPGVYTVVYKFLDWIKENSGVSA